MFTFSKMLKVFRDDAMQESFEKNGYVVAPFYTPEEISELKALYYRLHPKDEKGFFPSTFSKDKNYRAVADSEIRRICERSMNRYLQDTKTICGCFIVKAPGPESAMCVHQDMTLVDESKFTGINIWVPLVDLTATNGVLQVLPGSHRIYPTYRGSTIPGFYEGIDEKIKPYLQSLYLKAGEAVFFDQSIIHYSDANLSDDVRIVTNTYFTHKDADFRIAYWNKDFGNKVELFEEDDSFMTDFEQFGHNIHDKPKVGKSLGLVDYNFPKLTEDQLQQLYGKPVQPSTARKPLLKRVLDSMFS
ncbi:MAG TPA: phytanoyl-CoA dioxygenase family protein [Chitinophagales bacterium]|nr:phytanoyl-CoA dioxygenase family protein [Chitinophagales bacterium]